MLDELISKNIKFCKEARQYDPPLDNYTAAILTAMTIGAKKAEKENRALERKLQREEARRLKASAKTTGFTLVELLVVVTIMVLLLAISVPMFQPLLKSQQTHNAAQVLASTLQRTRAQAMREGRAVGVKFVPFDTAPTTAIQLRIARDAAPVINRPEEQRVRVVSGLITLIKYDADTNTWDKDTAALPPAFRPGAMIQFNRQGRFYELATPNTLKKPYDLLTFDAAEYLVRPPAATALSPPVIMPKATIVDLKFSGGRGTSEAQAGQFPVVFDASAEVTVMFSPSGAVQDVLFNDMYMYGNGEAVPVGTRVLPNEMLYFCVGDWDRQMVNGQSLADDGKSNVEVSSSYWVTIHPKTGAVRITENKAVNGTTNDDVVNARQYATEHYFDVGGN